jgi:gliding motility-associated protein GldE
LETESHLLGITCFSVYFNPIFWKYAVAGLLIAIILFILAVLSAAELSIFAISYLYNEKPGNNLSKRKSIVYKLVNDADCLRITFGILNTLLKVAVLVIPIANISLSGTALPWKTIPSIIAILTAGIVYIILIEIIPKTIANKKPEKYTLSIAYFLWTIHLLFKPLSFSFLAVTNWISQKISHSNRLSVGEISNAIEHGPEGLNEEEDILKGIVKFANIDVSQILKPRVDVIAIDFSTTLPDVLETVIESGYSRIPVYSGNFDNIKGILYVKDLMPFLNEKASFRWQNLIRKPYFVPDSKKIKELLTEFQTNKIHMAIIVDEYGGTLGIVTLEDILEEIVGEIADEADEDDKFYTKIDENTYIFDAKILLNDFYKIFHSEPGIFDQIKGDADTLAGLILELKGNIPEKNEEITFKQFVFKIEAVDSRRIKQIKVTVNTPDNNE